MAQPAAKQQDLVVSTDMHIVMVPSPSGQTPTPLPHPFKGTLDGNLSRNVFINGKAAATKGSVATNTPSHIPTPPGVSFQIPPTNQGTIEMGSSTVFINGQPAARNGDLARTCDDVNPTPHGTVQAMSTVLIGG